MAELSPNQVRASFVTELLEASNELRCHSFHKAIFDRVEDVLAEVARMFSCFSQDDTPLLRAYVDGGQRFGIIGKFVPGKSPIEKEDLETYLSERLASASFCVTFNGLTKWSESYAKLVQSAIVRPLVKRLGVPLSGCDTYAFVGNYGWTPFGAHDDDDHSLLLHLGPGAKKVYVWPRNEYRNLTGNLRTKTDFEDLLPNGRKFVMEPGDALFIPKGDFHVLETPEFSVMLGFTIFPFDPAENIKAALPDFLDVHEVEDVFFDQGVSKPATTILSRDLRMSELAEVRLKMLESNGYVTTRPKRRTGSYAQASLKGVANFPLTIWRNGEVGAATIFVKGHAIHFGVAGDLPEQIVAFINRDHTFSRSEFCDNFADAITEEASIRILDMIWELGGLEEQCGA